eukprot:993821-Amorphochlora_amoeboformis.AAC.1
MSHIPEFSRKIRERGSYNTVLRADNPNEFRHVEKCNIRGHPNACENPNSQKADHVAASRGWTSDRTCSGSKQTRKKRGLAVNSTIAVRVHY